MDRMKSTRANIVDNNVQKIAELFPGCVTESSGADGKIKKSIDFDLLRQELSDSIVEGPQERFHLNWPGKREALLTANAPIAKTLRPYRDESVDFDKTENLFIEGDNLEALKLLQETYLGKVKMIYIDPPYNTGNDFIYNDDFAETTNDFLRRTNQRDNSENRLVANTDANGRFHSDWLSMIYSRLKLARNLLRDDGIIFISIDDNEAHNLRKVCDELFGIDNLFGIFQWRRRQRADNRNQSRVSPDHEYIISYSKMGTSTFKGAKVDLSKYKNSDNDPRGPWASIDLSGLATATQRPNLHYEIVDPKTGLSYPPNPNRGWSKSKENVLIMIEEGKILFPKSPSGRPREKKFIKDLQSNVTGFSTCLDSEVVGFTTNGTREVTGLIGGKYFGFPKPLSLLEELINQTVDTDDTIVDFFAGSATTAHAVMQLNAEDGGNRKFIMVQLPEPCTKNSEAFKAGYQNIAEISKERIRRAGKKIIEGGCHENWNKDIGFRVLKIDSSNMTNVYYTPDATKQAELGMLTDNIKPGRSSEDLLFQVLLNWGVDLTLPIRTQSVRDKTIFFVDENALAACFDAGVDEELVKELARREPLRVVFRDTGFVSDAVKINVEQILQALSPGTKVRSV